MNITINTTVTVEIGDAVHVLTLDQANALYRALGEKLNLREVVAPIHVPTPIQPSIQDWQIICKQDMDSGIGMSVNHNGFEDKYY